MPQNRFALVLFECCWVVRDFVNKFCFSMSKIRCWPIHACGSLQCSPRRKKLKSTLVDTNFFVAPEAAIFPLHGFCTWDGQSASQKQNSWCTNLAFVTKNPNYSIQYGVFWIQQDDKWQEMTSRSSTKTERYWINRERNKNKAIVVC